MALPPINHTNHLNLTKLTMRPIKESPMKHPYPRLIQIRVLRVTSQTLPATKKNK
ncbi:putative ethylene-responsive transcription factor [Sesbania bispinosa]|nr:putative ethylene-responsive transcription factor [Sesbania bispinosa]